MKDKNQGIPKKKKIFEIIKFSKSVQRMFAEITSRQRMEINSALTEVYEELGLSERIKDQVKNKEEFTILENLEGIQIKKIVSKKVEIKNDK